MKLFARYNRINVISTIIIFLLGCIAFSVLLRYVIIHQIDEDLKIEKNEVISSVNRFHHLPLVIEVPDQYTTYTAIEKPDQPLNKIYTREAYDAFEKKKELRRTIEFDINVNNNWYMISVSKSLAGTEDLIQTIIIITITIIVLILAATFFINRIILRKLWQPFYSTLQTMQQFNLNNKQALHFSSTNIDEFSYLNTILTNALSKAQQDYLVLKEFTENASHELQTPLAVIQSKLDIIIQNEKLSEEETVAIQSAYNSVQYLNKLNRELLLLAKIENNQFNEQTQIDLKAVIQNKISQFAELWKSRNIILSLELTDKIIPGNKYLTEILINNLLSNATKHNIQNGFITIVLHNYLQITNTGAAKPLNENELYKRFSKQGSETDNLGLGLSIVQQICYASKFECNYNFQLPNLHSFTVSFINSNNAE